MVKPRFRRRMKKTETKNKDDDAPLDSYGNNNPLPSPPSGSNNPRPRPPPSPPDDDNDPRPRPPPLLSPPDGNNNPHPSPPGRNSGNNMPSDALAQPAATPTIFPDFTDDDVERIFRGIESLNEVRNQSGTNEERLKEMGHLLLKLELTLQWNIPLREFEDKLSSQTAGSKPSPRLTGRTPIESWEEMTKMLQGLEDLTNLKEKEQNEQVEKLKKQVDAQCFRADQARLVQRIQDNLFAQKEKREAATQQVQEMVKNARGTIAQFFNMQIIQGNQHGDLQAPFFYPQFTTTTYSPQTQRSERPLGDPRKKDRRLKAARKIEKMALKDIETPFTSISWVNTHLNYARPGAKAICERRSGPRDRRERQGKSGRGTWQPPPAAFLVNQGRDATTLNSAPREWQYDPQHPNKTIAAILAFTDYVEASMEAQSSLFVNARMENGITHLLKCIPGKTLNRHLNSLATHPAVLQRKYVPQHPNPNVAALLTRMSFEAASKAAGPNFERDLLELGKIHEGCCLSQSLQPQRPTSQLASGQLNNPVQPIVGVPLGQALSVPGFCSNPSPSSLYARRIAEPTRKLFGDMDDGPKLINSAAIGALRPTIAVTLPQPLTAVAPTHLHPTHVHSPYAQLSTQSATAAPPLVASLQHTTVNSSPGADLNPNANHLSPHTTSYTTHRDSPNRHGFVTDSDTDPSSFGSSSDSDNGFLQGSKQKSMQLKFENLLNTIPNAGDPSNAHPSLGPGVQDLYDSGSSSDLGGSDNGDVGNLGNDSHHNNSQKLFSYSPPPDSPGSSGSHNNEPRPSDADNEDEDGDVHGGFRILRHGVGMNRTRAGGGIRTRPLSVIRHRGIRTMPSSSVRHMTGYRPRASPTAASRQALQALVLTALGGHSGYRANSSFARAIMRFRNHHGGNSDDSSSGSSDDDQRKLRGRRKCKSSDSIFDNDDDSDNNDPFNNDGYKKGRLPLNSGPFDKSQKQNANVPAPSLSKKHGRDECRQGESDFGGINHGGTSGHESDNDTADEFLRRKRLRKNREPDQYQHKKCYNTIKRHCEARLQKSKSARERCCDHQSPCHPSKQDEAITSAPALAIDVPEPPPPEVDALRAAVDRLRNTINTQGIASNLVRVRTQARMPSIENQECEDPGRQRALQLTAAEATYFNQPRQYNDIQYPSNPKGTTIHVPVPEPLDLTQNRSAFYTLPRLDGASNIEPEEQGRPMNDRVQEFLKTITRHIEYNIPADPNQKRTQKRSYNERQEDDGRLSDTPETSKRRRTRSPEGYEPEEERGNERASELRRRPMLGKSLTFAGMTFDTVRRARRHKVYHRLARTGQGLALVVENMMKTNTRKRYLTGISQDKEADGERTKRSRSNSSLLNEHAE